VNDVASLTENGTSRTLARVRASKVLPIGVGLVSMRRGLRQFTSPTRSRWASADGSSQVNNCPGKITAGHVQYQNIALFK
jgi:hypothetical protein